MKRRGFFAALGAALAAPLALTGRVAKPKMFKAKWTITAEDQKAMNKLFDNNHPDIGVWRSQAMAENFRRAYGGERRT